MQDYQHRAALRQLEQKLARQEQAVEATKAMIELLRSQPIDNKTGKK